MQKFLVGAFEALTPDYEDIYQQAKPYTVRDWITEQQLKSGVAGGLGSMIPGWHLLTMPADAAFLVNRMSVCSYGVGAIIGYDAGLDNILEAEDLPVVLARWCGDEDLADAAIAKTAASLAGKVGGKAATKVLAKTMAEKTGLLIGKKLGGKLGGKLVAKFGSKLGGKALGGCIPVFGAVISGGVNAYFVGEIGAAAEDWYRTKITMTEA